MKTLEEIEKAIKEAEKGFNCNAERVEILAGKLDSQIWDFQVESKTEAALLALHLDKMAFKLRKGFNIKQG